MFTSTQPFRRETFYEGPASDHNRINAQVIGPDDDDDDGNPRWLIALPNDGGRIRTVFACELSPEPDAPQTVAEQIEHFLTWNHPLLHAFVIEALIKYSDQIIENREQVIENMKNSFISGDAWVHCAEEVLKEFKV